MPKKVFVSGSYDMLHSGHVAFFEEAASYGDLYVGLGSDKTIADLKARKTVNSDAERLYMVKSLKMVKDAWAEKKQVYIPFSRKGNLYEFDYVVMDNSLYYLELLFDYKQAIRYRVRTDK